MLFLTISSSDYPVISAEKREKDVVNFGLECTLGGGDILLVFLQISIKAMLECVRSRNSYLNKG